MAGRRKWRAPKWVRWLFAIAAAGLLIAGVFLIVADSVKLGFAAIGLGFLIALVFPGQKPGVPSVFPARWGQF